MNRVKLGVVLVLLTVRSASAVDSPSTNEITPEVIEVARGNNEFSTDLYARLISDDRTNLFFSPFSISTALAMTYAGAGGQTKTEMADVLHFRQEESELHAGFCSLRKMSTSSDKKSGFQLRIANRLWGQKNCQFLPKFREIAKSEYGADLGLLHFVQSNEAMMSINSWIEKQTDNKIQNLIGPGVLDKDTRLVLTNVIYFKARWENQFKEKSTSDASFYLTENQQATVPMMNQSGTFKYGEVDQLQILEMPYSHDSGLSMLILLPKRKSGLHDLEMLLSAENLQQWMAGMKSRKVFLSLPKFKTTSEFSLNDVLKSMGMALAFSNKADFSRMAKQEPLFISAVIHKAFVDVNEDGTEAAAATAVIMGALGARAVPEKPVEFRADHPFVFLIRHNRTQSILFLGRVMNPKE